MTRTWAAAVALAGAVVLCLAACNPGAPTPSGTPTTAPVTSSATPVHPTAVSTPSAVPRSDDVSGLAPCTRDDVQVVWADAGGSAGHFHGTITFTNGRGASACSLQGYPTVHFDGPEGQSPEGGDATHDAGTPAAVRVDVGGSVVAQVTVTDRDVLQPQCAYPYDATAMLVAMPGADVQFLDLHGSLPACVDTTTQLIQVTAFAHA
jgi:hypothetical protein